MRYSFDQSLALSEARLMQMEVGTNARTWWDDTTQTYLATPLRQGNIVKAAAGIVYVGLSGIVEFPDYLVAGLANKKLEPSTGLRVARDTRQLVSDVLNLRPIAALTDVIRLPGDVIMDTDKLLGFDHAQGSIGTYQTSTHGRTASLLTLPKAA